MRRQSLVGECIKLAGLNVALDRGIELSRAEGLEPSAKSSEFLRGKPFDGHLDVFGSGHAPEYNVRPTGAKEQLGRRHLQI